MEHVSEQTWVDSVRGISGSEIDTKAKAHLLTGCLQCNESYNRWGKVRRLAAQEVSYDPPKSIVRLVKLGFANKAASSTSKWPFASLVFDSFAQPLAYGVRSGAASAGPATGGPSAPAVWQVVYEAEGLTVDLRITYGARAQAVHLVGQVFDKQAVRPLQNNAIVELSTEGDAVIATSAVSPFGEFHIEFEAKDQLLLSVKAAGRNTVRIPLANVKLR
jgi:hypothetical protein